MADLIDRQAAIDALRTCQTYKFDPLDDRKITLVDAEDVIEALPSTDAVEVVRCKDCKHWRRQNNYAGAQLSFGFCESDDMWRSLYGETYEVSHIDTDDDFYCGYAERREDG